MSLFLSCSCHASATYLTNITAPLGIKHPYPKIFNKNVQKNGDIADFPVGEDVQSVAVMAGLHSGDSLANMYESFHKQAKKVKSIKRFHAFENWGLEQDEFKECLDNLLDYKEAYKDTYV